MATWTMHRLYGSVFFEDEDEEKIKAIQKKLRKLGVYAQYSPCLVTDGKDGEKPEGMC